MNRPPFAVTLATTADRDFLDIMDWSVDHFGADAADRYEALICQALTDLGEDPLRAGATSAGRPFQAIYTSTISPAAARSSLATR